MSLIKQFVEQRGGKTEDSAISLVKQFIAGTAGRHQAAWAAENAETDAEHEAAKAYHLQQIEDCPKASELHKLAVAAHELVLVRSAEELTAGSEQPQARISRVRASDAARRISRLIHFRLRD